MPLPLETRNNPNICKYIVLPLNELDEAWAIEQWERIPTDRDTAGDILTRTKPVYFGDWRDVTERVKAQQEVIRAELQLAKLKR